MTRHESILPRLLLWLIVGLTAGVPVLWAATVVAQTPKVVIAGVWDERMAILFARTVSFATLSAIGALAIAWPVAIAMGRTPHPIARALWMIVPLPLLLPTMVTGYGWGQLMELLSIHPMPQSWVDIARCIFILSAWLFPIPAVAIAMTLRRIDQSLLEQACIDGVLARLMGRRMVAPAIFSFAICIVLAMQEFSIFESPGISVMATEIRMIFETGQLSSKQNPIATLVGGVGVASASDLSQRAALSLAAGAPVIALTILLAIAATWAFRRMKPDETIELSHPPARLRAGWGWIAVAWVIVLLVVGLPVGAMFASLDKPLVVSNVLSALAPQLCWSIGIAICSGLMGIAIACLAAMVKPRLTIVLALVSFLIGGQFTAIAMLRIFSISDFGIHILDWNIPVILAHVARFAWIALLAGASLHAENWGFYRRMAEVDGASRGQIFRQVIVGMGWPVLMLAGVLIGSLSLTEVPATALLVPPSLVPMLLSWVHTQSYGPMLEASLMLCGIVLILGWCAAACVVIMRKRIPSRDRKFERGTQTE